VIVDSVMTDHPSWLSTDNGAAYRAVRCGNAVWSLTVTPADGGGRHTGAHRVSGVSDAPMLDVIDPAALTGSTAMVASLCAAGTVARWRNPDLWDALATAIVRQVIRAGQARKLYRAFNQAYGESVSTPAGDRAMPGTWRRTSTPCRSWTVVSWRKIRTWRPGDGRPTWSGRGAARMTARSAVLRSRPTPTSPSAPVTRATSSPRCTNCVTRASERSGSSTICSWAPAG
jgi:hypothetical protein